MKILILGATGTVGQAYVQEALSRGHHVTATSRRSATVGPHGDTLSYQCIDVLNDAQALTSLVAAHDVTLSALRPAAGQETTLVAMTQAALTAARAGKKRVYVTGGAAPLLLADESGDTVLSAPGFLPDSVRPIAEACGQQDKLLETYDDTDWVCLRPAAQLLQGARTGRYALGRDTLIVQSDNQSRISYADFAVAMLDLVELDPRTRQRLTVGW